MSAGSVAVVLAFCTQLSFSAQIGPSSVGSRTSRHTAAGRCTRRAAARSPTSTRNALKNV
ncbi:hypothetical protein PR003_g17532 [Phytophthora rubi]|uniref:RxLR effector protein n=1 Tax=Phytophthora rubi TaxID=129364 RepID=A0A6A3JNN4_9STRA|nr:hypothetical protein PR001_g20209 [Phytophthora rubi]KAE9005262.1 hypothetical protein PR002_g16821 [Phytophthora rubi]KAE9321211.1 hypothetical protein PR003_g17532 [Phytophthora rubi]